MHKGFFELHPQGRVNILTVVVGENFRSKCLGVLLKNVNDCKIIGFKKLQHSWIASAFNEHIHVHVMCTWKIDRNVHINKCSAHAHERNIAKNNVHVLTQSSGIQEEFVLLLFC